MGKNHPGLADSANPLFRRALLWAAGPHHVMLVTRFVTETHTREQIRLPYEVRATSDWHCLLYPPGLRGTRSAD